MNIYIQPSALKKEGGKLLRPGALYGIKRLTELGHAVSFDAEQLSEPQQKLLENERIAPAGFAANESDLTVEAEGDLLTTDAEKNPPVEAEDWIALSNALCFPGRTASLKRSTSETDISIELNLDGTGKAEIRTGLPFLDHMLEQIAKHGLTDLTLQCDGDLEVDEHHTIEDVAITLGKAIAEAVGDKTGIRRYAFVLPMDESRCTAALDLSGRPYLVFEGTFNREKVGDFPTDMVEHFFYSLAINAEATLHLNVEGQNDHHKIEACFKAFAHCLRAAVSRSERTLNMLPSTKNLL